MSALLDMSTGSAAIAYVGATPWHGEGQKLAKGASIAEWTSAARLDWQALPLISAYKDEKGEYHDLEDRMTLIRSDNRAYLGQFSKLYMPVQPAQILAFFNDYILVDPRFTIETAGALRGGRVIWALARFEETTKLFGKDHETHVQYVFLCTSFDGTLATTAQATVTRVVCNNTLTASIFDPQAATFRMRHNKEFTGFVAEDAANQLAAVAGSFGQYAALAEALNETKVSRDLINTFFEKQLPPKVIDAKTKKISVKSENSRIRAMAAFNDLLDKTIRQGGERDTAWTLYNAATDFADHVRGVKKTNKGETDGQARMFSTLLGGAQQAKKKALADIFDLTGLDIKDFGGKGETDVTDGVELLAA